MVNQFQAMMKQMMAAHSKPSTSVESKVKDLVESKILR